MRGAPRTCGASTNGALRSTRRPDDFSIFSTRRRTWSSESTVVVSSCRPARATNTFVGCLMRLADLKLSRRRLRPCGSARRWRALDVRQPRDSRLHPPGCGPGPESEPPVVSRHREEVGPTVVGSPSEGCGNRCAVCRAGSVTGSWFIRSCGAWARESCSCYSALLSIWHQSWSLLPEPPSAC